MKKFFKRLFGPIIHWWKMRKIPKAVDNDEDPFIYD